MLGYRIAIDGRLLRIRHERGAPVEVEIEPWGFVVRGGGGVARFGLCEAHALAEHVLAELEGERRAGVARLPQWVVGGHLLELRERGLPHLNPTADAVIRRVLSVARRAPRLAGAAALYGETYVVRDVLRYRAAAIALAFLESDLLGPWLLAHGGAPDGAHPDGPDAVAMAALRDWRSLFSPDARTYRSLDRTLMNLPAGIPPRLVCALSRIRLERPLTGSATATALLLLLSDRHRGRAGDAVAGHATVFLRASEADVAAACAIPGRHTQQRLDPRRTRDLRTLVSYVLDYPVRYHGNLPGLVRRAIRWHARRARRARPAAAHLLTVPGGSTRPPALDPTSVATMRPPIALPEHSGITFLSTVAAIEREGQHMEHCIADYVKDAVCGECYLFHVSYAGSEASVEVSPDGDVRQSAGPRNVANAASRWGARVLRDWGRKLRLERSGIEPLPRARPRPAAEHGPAAGRGQQLLLLLLRA